MTAALLDELSVEVYVDVLGLDLFRLDTSRLDVDVLHDAMVDESEGLFRLDRSRLNDAALSGVLPTKEWRAVLGHAREVRIRRGANRADLAPQMETGVASVTFVNALDPRTTPGLRPSAPLRVLHLPTGRPLFTGRIEDLHVTTSHGKATRRQTRFVTVTAVDAGHVYANTRRHGATTEVNDDGDAPPETWADRIHRLMRSAPDQPYVIDDDGDPGWLLCSTVHESTLAKHLDLACASVRARWWVDADGVTRFAVRPHGAQTAARFTDVPSPDPLARSYTDIDEAFDTATLVNTLALINHERTPDPDRPGTYLAADVTYGPFVNITSRATYGPRAAELEATLDPPSVPAAGAAWVADLPRDVRPQSLEFEGGREPEFTASLDVYAGVDVVRRGTVYPCAVLTIEHTIVPRRWMTRLDLIERADT